MDIYIYRTLYDIYLCGKIVLCLESFAERYQANEEMMSDAIFSASMSAN
jgi:hypothetical protein